MSLDPKDIIQLVAYLIMIVVFVMKLATKEEVRGVYARFDSYKEEFKNTYFRTEMAEYQRLQVKDELLKHELEYKELRKEISDNQTKMFELLNLMNLRINELKELIIKIQK